MASSSARLRLVVVIALAAWCGNALAIFKCQDAQGKTTYQQKPCEGSAAQTNIGGDTRPPPAGPRAGAAPPAGSQPPSVANLMSAVVRCSEQVPSFAERIQVTYGRWVDANNEAVQNFQRTPEYGRMVGDAKKETTTTGGKPSAYRVEECKRTEDYFAQNWGAGR